MPNAQKLWRDFMNSAGSGNAGPRAARQFIGRDELIKLYFELKDRAQREQFEGCYVVNFYGEPGIGKSTLLRQIESRLQKEAKDSKKKPPVILRAGFDESWLTGGDGLIASLGNAVFAVAGREPLPCKEEEDNWHIIRVNADTGESEKYQRKLDVLSDAESRALLTGCGMSDELAGAVCRLTAGDPVFLELCLDQYDHLIAAGETPTPDKFGKDTARLVERHTRYLPAHLWEPLSLLAAMGRWTDAQYDAIREAAGLLYYPISDSADYRRLTGLSYVWPEGDGWAMRDNVADVLAKGLTFGIRSGVLDKMISLASAEETAFRLRSAEAWYALAFHMWETYRDTLPFSKQCAFLRNWGGVCDELQELLLDESEKRRFAGSGEKAWALLMELCENKQNTRDKPTPDSCRAQYELGRHYWDVREWELCVSHLRQAVQGYRELGGACSVNTLLAEGALRAAFDRLGGHDADPEADGFDWEYAWTGTESAEDLELLQEWACFRLNSDGGSLDGYYSMMRKIAGAYLSLGGKPSRSALAAEIQTIGLYVPQQYDPQRRAKFENQGSEDARIDGREWNWNTSLFQDYNTGAETAKICMELVERAKRVLSPADPLIAFALDALARAQEGQCLYHLAIPIRQEALTLLLAAYGPGAKDTLNQEKALIDAYRKAKKLNDAIRLQQNRLEYARETSDTFRRKAELARAADLYRHLLSAADGDEQTRECFTALNELLEELRALPGTVFEENIVPWGRAAVWCLNHAEKDVESDTERFVSAVVDFCKDIPHMVLYVAEDGTAAQVILRGMEEESGWRHELWENCRPDNE